MVVRSICSKLKIGAGFWLPMDGTSLSWTYQHWGPSWITPGKVKTLVMRSLACLVESCLSDGILQLNSNLNSLLSRSTIRPNPSPTLLCPALSKLSWALPTDSEMQRCNHGQDLLGFYTTFGRGQTSRHDYILSKEIVREPMGCPRN